MQSIPACVNAIVLYDSVDGDLTALCKCLLDCRRSVIGTVNVEAGGSDPSSKGSVFYGVAGGVRFRAGSIWLFGFTGGSAGIS